MTRKVRWLPAVLYMLLVSSAFCQDPGQATTSAATPVTGDANAQNQLKDSLIYSVDRVPERLFDTSRAVEVITQEQILRANARTLADLLEEHAGLAVSASTSGGIPIARGLSNKQVMLLIDGVKGQRRHLGCLDPRVSGHDLARSDRPH